MDDEFLPEDDIEEEVEAPPPVISQVQEIYPEAPEEVISSHVNQFRSVNPKATDEDVLTVAQGLKEQSSPSALEAPSMSEFRSAAPAQMSEDARPSFRVDPQQILQLQEKARKAAEIHPIIKLMRFAPRFSGAANSMINEKYAEAQGYNDQIKNMMAAAKDARQEYRYDSEEKRRSAAEGRAQEEYAQKKSLAAEGGSLDSPQAVLYRSLLEKMTPEQKAILSQIPAAQLAKAIPLVKGVHQALSGEKLAQARLAESKAYHGQMQGEREESRGLRQDIKFRDEVAKYSDRIVKDPIIKKMQEQGISLDSVADLSKFSKSGNTVAGNALGAKMARAMGEVGVLTETDVKRYTSSGRLDRRSADTLSKWMSGKPTDATLKEINQIADIMRENYSGKIQTRTDRYIKEFAKTHGMEPKEAADWLQHPFSGDSAAPSSVEVERTTKDGKTAIFDAETKKFLRYK